MQSVNGTSGRKNATAFGIAAGMLLAGCCAARANGETFSELIRVPGGVPGNPIITSLSLPSPTATNATLFWSGFGGPFQVESRPNLSEGAWVPVGNPTFTLSNTVPAASSNYLFRIAAPAPQYAGADTCRTCHGDTHQEWSATRHAGAFDALKAVHQETNANCLACHTVGFGLPTGFKDELTTAHFAGAQCENCHGPAGDHASDPFGVVPPVLRPQAEMCGGCHASVPDPAYGATVHPPTYDDWRNSGHARVTAEVAAEFLNATNGVARMKSCGPCHSGAVRLAMVANVEDGVPLVFPSGAEAGALPITCVVCHDPMANTDNPVQLRYPLASLTAYSYSTSSTNSFAAQYDPSINICGQCHNLRGAAWTDTSRPPHHSAQYNIFLGNGGVEDGVAPQAPHRKIADQCVTCHMHPKTPETGSETTPIHSGHSFEVKLSSCAPCHDEEEAAMFLDVTPAFTKKLLGKLKDQLDQWATTKAPEALRSKYGALAWEYTTPGEFSTLPSTLTSGPTAKEQAVVPDGIKQARYNLYLVANEGSFGVHNGQYTRYLLKLAKDKVNAELAR